MSRRRLPLALLLTAALGGGLAACGDDGEEPVVNEPGAVGEQVNPSVDSDAEVDNDASEPNAAGGEVLVGMEGLEFQPTEIRVAVGQTIVWRNDESIPHNVVAREGADFASETFGEGGTFEYRPTEAGTIEYVCTLHPGMDGTVVVEG